MSIKWSALQVSEAMDMVEEYINEAAEPLEQAKIVAIVAVKIASVPQYVSERLVTLIGNIEHIENIRRSIKVVRDSLPEGAVEDERKRLESGKQLSLVT
jgi:hypothetical protein